MYPVGRVGDVMHCIDKMAFRCLKPIISEIVNRAALTFCMQSYIEHGHKSSMFHIS